MKRNSKSLPLLSRFKDFLFSAGRVAFKLLLMVLLTQSAAAGDWFGFRGSDGSGIAADSKPPTTWNDAKHLRWKAAMPGPGTSSPIIVGDRLFVTCWTGYGQGDSSGQSGLQRYLLCLDRNTGRIIWTKSIAGESRPDSYDGYLEEHGFASHTPVSDGKNIYTFWGKGGAQAFDLDGNELWKVNLGQESNAKNWGSASSPVLYGDFVLINASEEAHALYALDKKTGKTIWKTEAEGLQYVFGTPVLANRPQGAELLLAIPGEVWALNPETGKLRWFAETGFGGNIAPSVVLGQDTVYTFGGFPKLGAAAVKLGGKGDVSNSNVLWKSGNSTYVPTPVLHEDRLYFASDSGFAICLDAKSGDLIFKERLPGASASGRGGKPFYASAVLANDHIYAVSRRNGTFVFEAKPEFTLVAHNKLSDDSQFNATPAVTKNQIFLRSDKFVYCIQETPSSAGGATQTQTSSL